MKKAGFLLLFLFFLFLTGCFFRSELKLLSGYLVLKTTKTQSIQDRLARFGPLVEKRLAPFFQQAGIAYPPDRLVLIGLKAEKCLEVHASTGDLPMKPLRAYPVLAASGGPGPKFREGDGQVPEGIYGIDYLNPNSLYHLSMRISYPNAGDRAQARREGRTGLGGDIMIHGNQVSIGCLAMGDEAAEDLFVLAALTGKGNIRVILCPYDFRDLSAEPEKTGNPFVDGLYRTLRNEIASFPKIVREP